MNNKCNLKSCTKPSYSIGLCKNHYNKKYRASVTLRKREEYVKKMLTMCFWCNSSNVNVDSGTCNDCGTTAPNIRPISESKYSVRRRNSIRHVEHDFGTFDYDATTVSSDSA